MEAMTRGVAPFVLEATATCTTSLSASSMTRYAKAGEAVKRGCEKMSRGTHLQLAQLPVPRSREDSVSDVHPWRKERRGAGDEMRRKREEMKGRESRVARLQLLVLMQQR